MGHSVLKSGKSQANLNEMGSLWLINAFPGSPSCSIAHWNFPTQVGQKLNCNKSECFVDVSLVPFFGICSFLSVLLFVERPNILILP